MKRVEIIFKSGASITVSCEGCTIKSNTITGKLVSYEIRGIEGDKPLFIDIDEVVCVTTT